MLFVSTGRVGPYFRSAMRDNTMLYHIIIILSLLPVFCFVPLLLRLTSGLLRNLNYFLRSSKSFYCVFVFTPYTFSSPYSSHDVGMNSCAGGFSILICMCVLQEKSEEESPKRKRQPINLGVFEKIFCMRKRHKKKHHITEAHGQHHPYCCAFNWPRE